MISRIKKSVQALKAYVPGEQSSDPGIVKLNTNENPYPPSPRVKQVLAEYASDALRRYPDPLCLRLRARIAELHGCSSDQVIVGNGSDEILALCLRAFVERNGRVSFFDPSYSLYATLAGIEELATALVPLTADFGWVTPPADGSDLFFLTYPNAPTSVAYAKEDIRAFCEVYDGIVVIDEAYVDFADVDCADLALTFSNVLVVRTLSKSYSLAGIRLGYAIGPAALIQAFYKIKDSYNVNALTQAIGLAALEDPDHMRRNVDKIRATRARVTDALMGAGFTVTPSQTNFLWVRPSGRSARDWFDVLREEKMIVRFFPGPRTGDYLRITIGSDPEMDRFLGVVRDQAPK